ncbi:unnamed protein product, partial [Hapterophycus canaliculatus]
VVTTVAVALCIENRYDFTDDLWEVLSFDWRVEVDGVVIASGAELAPSAGGCGEGTTARLAFEVPSLPLRNEEFLLTVTGRLRAGAPWAAAGHVVGHTQL